MCKAAVTALEARRAGIERDIASYITQRAHDVKRLEDQVRAEIEVLWDRYVQGPLGGKDVDRRGSISLTRPPPGTASAEPKATAAGDAAAKAHADEMEEIDLAFDRQWQKDALPSGVIPDPPSMSNSQFNSHTAVAASSLLSASLVTNAFYAPPPRPTAQRVVDIEELAKTTSRDNAAAREVAISYAFSNMALARGAGVPAEDEVDTPDVEEEEPEEREKGIDSWIAMERAQAVAAAAETPSNVENNIIIVNGANKAEDKDKDKSADAKKVVSDDKKPRGHVTFQEPAKPVRDKADAEDGNDDEGVDDDDGKLDSYVKADTLQTTSSTWKETTSSSATRNPWSSRSWWPPSGGRYGRWWSTTSRGRLPLMRRATARRGGPSRLVACGRTRTRTKMTPPTMTCPTAAGWRAPCPST
jgi:hypothetical protein